MTTSPESDSSVGPARTPTAEEAQAFIDAADFIWHQRFQLVPGVYTPAASDTERLIELLDLPADLTGKTVLDIGANNGGISFEMERRGAARVVAVDIMDPEQYGFSQMKSFLGSKVEYLQGSLYEVEARLNEQFDIVLFLGVLYHLRHPILALDILRNLTRSVALIETAVADKVLEDIREAPVAYYYRKDELNNDGSNWFTPTIACLLDWCRSSGFEPEVLTRMKRAPARAVVRCTPTPGDPEYLALSYERPLKVVVE